jgi:tRNA 2-selenouridine synthase
MVLFNVSQLAENNGLLPVIDVRSEGEFEHGHIPGAINIPLLNNAHREEVGICYKNKGNEAAVLLGYTLAGPHFHELIRKALETVPSKKAIVHCWRGGLRSKIFSELLENAGFTVFRLAGGYKAYRRQVLQVFEKPFQITVLGGLTCSGKTELLNLLPAQSMQMIDLEKIANHKGSAFGGLGRIQPTQEQFENELARQIMMLDDKQMIWVEDESQAIGRNIIPNPFWKRMREALLVEIQIPMEIRLQRALNEYGSFSTALLEERTFTLRKRLGDLKTKDAVEHLNNKDLKSWASMLLDYYDKTYSYGQSKREALKRIKIELDSPLNIDEFINQLRALEILEKQKGAKAP